MRRILIAAAATTALAAPAAALAHDGAGQRVEDHHDAVHREQHRARHHHARLRAFHAQAPAATTQPSGTAAPTPAMERAGTIASFSSGTLTITLNDGSTVSGKVTPRTEIECHAVIAGAASDGDGARAGDRDDDRGNDNSSGPGPGNGQQGDFSGHDGRDNDGAGDDGAGDDGAEDEAEHCTTAALVPGASVREALLSVGGGGSSWVRLEL